MSLRVVLTILAIHNELTTVEIVHAACNLISTSDVLLALERLADMGYVRRWTRRCAVETCDVLTDEQLLRMRMVIIDRPWRLTMTGRNDPLRFLC